jgi:hypothetical protein
MFNTTSVFVIPTTSTFDQFAIIQLNESVIIHFVVLFFFFFCVSSKSCGVSGGATQAFLAGAASAAGASVAGTSATGASAAGASAAGASAAGAVASATGASVEAASVETSAAAGAFVVAVHSSRNLGYISKPFDPVSNHKNTLLGSHLNASVQASIYQEVRIGKHISWNAGASFLHLSNGLTTLPNLGLNIPAITTGFAWRLPMRDTIRRNTETVLHKNSWQAWATVGPKQWPLVNSPRRIVSVLGVEWSRRLHANGRWGALVQLLHDPSPISPSDTIQKAPAGGGFQVGLGVHYTIIFNRLELPLQAAVYAFNQRDGNTLYESIGVRYQVNRRLYAGIHLKTHMGKADYLHAGIGYEW